jgi:hypothetical protein
VRRCRYQERRGHGFSIATSRWLALVFIFCVGTLTDPVGQSAPPQDPTPAQIIQFLSQTIDWYRHTQQEQHIATEPSDLGYVADNRRIAGQVVKLAFDFARAEEQQQAKQSKTSANATPSSSASQYESLSRAATGADQLVQQTQAELESLQRSLETAPPAKRRQLQTQLAELQSELGLFHARQQALHSMLDFASGASSANGATSLRAQIEELDRAVPPAVSGTSTNEITSITDQQSSETPGDISNKPSPTGMWTLLADLFRLSSKRTGLSNDLRVTQTNVARASAGPRVVANEISVEPVGNEGESRKMESNLDDGIESNFKAVLISRGLDKQHIRYNAKNGVLTLKGSVKSSTQRQQAQELARNTPNVQQVVNEIQVER